MSEKIPGLYVEILRERIIAHLRSARHLQLLTFYRYLNPKGPVATFYRAFIYKNRPFDILGKKMEYSICYTLIKTLCMSIFISHGGSDITDHNNEI